MCRVLILSHNFQGVVHFIVNLREMCVLNNSQMASHKIVTDRHIAISELNKRQKDVTQGAVSGHLVS